MSERQNPGQINVNLREASERIRALLASANRNDALSRYQAGAIVAEVKRSAHKYGDHAVPQLARELGQDEHTLYRYASVPERWTPAEMEAVLQRTSRFGQPLSWSHLVLLAGVESTRRRAQLLDLALRDGLSVRELAHAAAMGGDGRADTNATFVTERFVRTVERWSRAVAEAHNELLADLGSRLGDPSEAEALLERAIAAQERLAETAQEQLKRLRTKRGQLRRGSEPATCMLIAGGGRESGL